MKNAISATLFLALFIGAVPPCEAQIQKWVSFFDAYGKNDRIADVALDERGNMYVAGWITNASDNTDYFVAMYDPSGTRKWLKTYDNGGNDQAFSLAVRHGKIYVTGTSRSGSGIGADNDIVTFILDTAGTTDMSNTNALRYDYREQHRDDAGVKIALAKSGLLFSSGLHLDSTAAVRDTFFVAGMHKDSASEANKVTVLMYDSTGLLHEGSFVSDGSHDVIGMEVVDNDNLYVVTNSLVPLPSPLGTLNTYTAAKFGKDLAPEWVRTSDEHDFSIPTAMTADENGVYLTGTGAVCERDVVTVKYDVGGSLKWVARSYECAFTQVSAGAILLHHNSVYASGYHANGSQYFQYDKSTGIEGRGAGSAIQSFWNSLHVDSTTGNLYAAGNSLLFDQPVAWHLAKFNAADSLLWDIVYDGSGVGSPNRMSKMVLSPIDSSIVMVGSTTSGNQENIMIAKYSMGQLGTLSAKQHPHAPWQYALEQNYPNPFNPATTVRFTLRAASEVTLKVYDMLGREVRILLDNQVQSAGPHEVSFNADRLASGVYFYRISTVDRAFHDMKKMVLIR